MFKKVGTFEKVRSTFIFPILLLISSRLSCKYMFLKIICCIFAIDSSSRWDGKYPGFPFSPKNQGKNFRICPNFNVSNCA